MTQVDTNTRSIEVLETFATFVAKLDSLDDSDRRIIMDGLNNHFGSMTATNGGATISTRRQQTGETRMQGEWITVSDAAKELGINRASAYQLLKRGKLKGQEVEGRMVIPRQAVSAYQTQRAGRL